MKLPGMITDNLRLKALALFFGILVWAFATFEKEAEVGLTVPVTVQGLAPGLVLANPPPASVDVRVAGSKILLLRIRTARLQIPLELQGVTAGTVALTGFDRSLDLPAGVRVIRVHPATIELKLIPQGGTP